MELSRSKQLSWETISLRFAKREVYRVELSRDFLYPLKNKVLGGGGVVENWTSRMSSRKGIFHFLLEFSIRPTSCPARVIQCHMCQEPQREAHIAADNHTRSVQAAHPKGMGTTVYHITNEFLRKPYTK